MKPCKTCGYYGQVDDSNGTFVSVCPECGGKSAEYLRKNPAAVALGRLGGSKGGKASGGRKAEASRENGRKGGRPKRDKSSIISAYDPVTSLKIKAL